MKRREISNTLFPLKQIKNCFILIQNIGGKVEEDIQQEIQFLFFTFLRQRRIAFVNILEYRFLDRRIELKGRIYIHVP